MVDSDKYMVVGDVDTSETVWCVVMFLNDDEILRESLMEAVEVISLINELIKKETMDGVDYTGVYEDLKWNKIILRNRLEALDEAESRWMTAHEYMGKLNEEK